MVRVLALVVWGCCVSADVVELAQSSPRGAAFLLTPDEMSVLFGVGPLAMSLYVWLRSWMDFRTGLVGVTRSLSREMLATYTGTEVPRGNGTQQLRPTVKQVRVALQGLERVGLLRRRDTNLLVFSMPRARIGQVRPFQTGPSEGRDEGRATASIGAALREVGESENEPNRANNSSQVVLLSTQQAASQVPPVVDAVDKSIADAAAPDAATPEKPAPRRKAQPQTIEDLLASHAVTKIDSAVVARWIADGYRADHVLTAIGKAKALRIKAGSDVPIPLGLINTILSDIKLPRATKAKSKASAGNPRWDDNSATIRQKARELGMSEGINHETKQLETWGVFVERIRARVAQEGGDHG
jgi:hypothetical protein